MRIGNRKYVFSLLMVALMAFTSIPFAAFHHHDHPAVCDVGSDLPLQFKIEKDQAKHHLHKHESKCFVCSATLINSYDKEPEHQVIPVHCSSVIISGYELVSSVSFPSILRNKAPPAA